MQDVKEAAPSERVERVPVMERNIPPPFSALQDVNVFVSSMVREELEETLPKNAPPFSIVEQESNVQEEMMRLGAEKEEEEGSVKDIAPPFSDEHDVKIAPEIVCSPSIHLNSNTLPFPDSLLIDVNVFLPLSVRYPPLTDINGCLHVE